MTRLVLDTDVMFCSAFSNGASSLIFDEIVNGKYEILYSNALLFEYESVLSRNCKNDQDINDVADILRFIVEFGEKVHIYYFYRTLSKNQKDSMIVDTVINGFADYLVTFNKKHFYPFENVTIYKPCDFLNEVVRHDSN